MSEQNFGRQNRDLSKPTIRPSDAFSPLLADSQECIIEIENIQSDFLVEITAMRNQPRRNVRFLYV